MPDDRVDRYPGVTMSTLLKILVVVVALGALWWFRGTLFPPDPVAVRVERAERGRVEASVTNSKAGTVKARRRAKLSPGTSGIVTELLVDRGDLVVQGDVLLRLDDASQAASLALTEAGLAVAQASQRRACIAADRARRELVRNQELAADELVSVDALDRLQSLSDEAQVSCEVAQAEVEHARAQVTVAQAELDKTVVRAPFDAIIAEVSVELGEWVTPSVPLMSAPDLIEAIDRTSLYVAAPMDEVDAGSLHTGQRVRLTIDSHPGQEFAGTLTVVAPYVLDVESQNRTVEVEVELTDGDLAATLLPGTSADVEVILDVHDDVLAVPAFALLEGGRVLVLEDGVLVERVLDVGLRNWSRAEVLSGLSEGALVVTSLDREGVVVGAVAVDEDAARAPAAP